jgi:hypothetical protein
MRRIRVFSVVLLLAMVMCLSACGKSDKKMIVGTWNTTSNFEDQTTVIFNENGTFKWIRHSTLGDVTSSGKFVLDEKTKSLTMYPSDNTDNTNADAAKEWTFSYTFAEDTLTFHNASTKQLAYTFSKQK